MSLEKVRREIYDLINELEEYDNDERYELIELLFKCKTIEQYLRFINRKLCFGDYMIGFYSFKTKYTKINNIKRELIRKKINVLADPLIHIKKNNNMDYITLEKMLWKFEV